MRWTIPDWDFQHGLQLMICIIHLDIHIFAKCHYDLINLKGDSNRLANMKFQTYAHTFLSLSFKITVKSKKSIYTKKVSYLFQIPQLFYTFCLLFS